MDGFLRWDLPRWSLERVGRMEVEGYWMTRLASLGSTGGLGARMAGERAGYTTCTPSH